MKCLVLKYQINNTIIDFLVNYFRTKNIDYILLESPQEIFNFLAYSKIENYDLLFAYDTPSIFHEMLEKLDDITNNFIFFTSADTFNIDHSKVQYIYLFQPNNFIFKILDSIINNFLLKEELGKEKEKIKELRHSFEHFSEDVNKNVEAENASSHTERKMLEEINRFIYYNLARAEVEKEKAYKIREFIEIIINFIPLGIIVINKKSNIQIWNKKLETLFDISRDRILHRNIFTAIPELIKLGFQEHIDEVRANRQSLILDEYKYHFHGKQFIFKINIFNIGDDNVGLIIDDITQQTLLKEYSIIGGMSFYISHVIRNSLITIGGFFNKFCQDAEDKNICNDRYKNIIENEISKIEKMVYQITYFYSLINSTMKKSTEKINFHDVCFLYYNEIKEKKLILERKNTILKTNYFDFIEIVDISKDMLKDRFAIFDKTKFFEIFDFFWNDILFIKSSELVLVEHLECFEDGKFFVFDMVLNFFEPLKIRLETLFSPWQHTIFTNDIVSWGFAITKKGIENFGGAMKYTISEDKKRINFKFYFLKG